MRFLDTQVLSYVFKGTSDLPISNDYVSSVVANEFLGAHARDPKTASYYVPINGLFFEQSGHLGSLGQSIRDRYRKRPFPRASTDRINLYFGQDYPAVTEFGSSAISRIVNARALRAFRLAIATLDKRKQRRLVKRFEFLADNRIVCAALQPSSARFAQKLLYQFAKQYAPKKNFRNSLNDILILAVALDNQAQLVTKDSVLASFCERNGLLKRHDHGIWVRCEPEQLTPDRNVSYKESKGYVNRSWQVRTRRATSMRIR